MEALEDQLSAALEYASRGWQVIPLHSIDDGACTCDKAECSSPGKHPRTASGLKDATTDKYTIRDWWRKWPDANVGIVTGATSGLVVLDIDPRHDGWPSINAWESEGFKLPATCEVVTGGEGHHYYFRHPGETIKNRSNLEPGIDIRGDGGYVVAPPSDHVSGGSYFWDEGRGPYEIELAPIPDWLLAKLRETPKHKTNGTAPAVNGRGSLLQKASQYAAKAESALQGDRNAAAFRLAGQLAAFTSDGSRLNEAEIHELARGWNLRNSPPLDDAELRTCVMSALTNGSPRAEKNIQQRNETRNSEPDEEQTRVPIAKYTLTELRAAFPKLSPPVIHGLIRRGETANLISLAKMGKSWMSCHLEICIALGLPFLGKFQTTSGRVLKVDNELDPSVLAHRYPIVGDAMGHFASDYSDLIDVWPLRGNLRSLNRLMEEFEELPRSYYQAIVFDAKYRFGNGESENDNAAETVLYNTLDQIARQTGAALFLIHHSSKGSQSDKRVTDVGSGAGAQSRAADCHIVLREHEEPGTVVLDAAVRSFPPVDSVALKWRFPLWEACEADTTLLKGRKPLREQQQEERDKADLDKIVSVLSKGPATTRAIRTQTGWGKSKVDRLLDKLTAAEQVSVSESTVKGNKCNEYCLIESPE